MKEEFVHGANDPGFLYIRRHTHRHQYCRNFTLTNTIASSWVEKILHTFCLHSNLAGNADHSVTEFPATSLKQVQNKCQGLAVNVTNVLGIQ